MTPNPSSSILPDLAELPARVDRKRGAELVTKYFYPVSARTLERCGLPSRRVNGRALYETRALLELAAKKLEAAPVLATGRAAAEAS